MKCDSNEPLPDKLLPDPLVNDDPARWDAQVRSLMAAATPMMTRYRTNEIPWWALLAGRFRPRLAIAAGAAAAVAIAVHLTIPVRSAPVVESLPLATLISEGQPTTFLSVASGEHDPTLALVLLEGESP